MAPADKPSSLPRGSILGLALFVIFIDTLAKGTRNPCYLFVDVEVACADLEEDAEAVKVWLSKWDVPLNLAVSKTDLWGRT